MGGSVAQATTVRRVDSRRTGSTPSSGQRGRHGVVAGVPGLDVRARAVDDLSTKARRYRGVLVVVEASAPRDLDDQSHQSIAARRTQLDPGLVVVRWRERAHVQTARRYVVREAQVVAFAARAAKGYGGSVEQARALAVVDATGA